MTYLNLYIKTPTKVLNYIDSVDQSLQKEYQFITKPLKSISLLKVPVKKECLSDIEKIIQEFLKHNPTIKMKFMTPHEYGRNYSKVILFEDGGPRYHTALRMQEMILPQIKPYLDTSHPLKAEHIHPSYKEAQIYRQEYGTDNVLRGYARNLAILILEDLKNRKEIIKVIKKNHPIDYVAKEEINYKFTNR